MTTATRTPQLHVRYDGRSFDVGLDELDVGILSNDGEVRVAAAGYLTRFLETDIPASKLQSFVVDRNQASGDLDLRPPAVFG